MLIVMLYKVALTLEIVWKSGVTIKMKAVKQHCSVVMFIVPYKVVLTSEFVEEILGYDHSNESY